jgi:hypothetical protein
MPFSRWAEVMFSHSQDRCVTILAFRCQISSSGNHGLFIASGFGRLMIRGLFVQISWGLSFHHWYYWIRLSCIKQFGFLTQRQENRRENQTPKPTCQKGTRRTSTLTQPRTVVDPSAASRQVGTPVGMTVINPDIETIWIPAFAGMTTAARTRRSESLQMDSDTRKTERRSGGGVGGG